jgi:hypothetical protein
MQKRDIIGDASQNAASAGQDTTRIQDKFLYGERKIAGRAFGKGACNLGRRAGRVKQRPEYPDLFASNAHNSSGRRNLENRRWQVASLQLWEQDTRLTMRRLTPEIGGGTTSAG